MYKILLQQTIAHQIDKIRPIIKPRSKIYTIYLESSLTHFDLNKYIKKNKKGSLMDTLQSTDKPVLQYNVTGKCLRYQRKHFNTSFLIRNIISLTSFEMIFPLYTTLIFLLYTHKSRKKFFRSNQYFLRKHAPVKSKINFFYVIGEVE